MAAFVADRGETDAILTRRADARHPDGGTIQLGTNRQLRCVRRLAPEMFGKSHLDVLAVDEHVDERSRLARDHERVDTEKLQFQSKMARRERVCNQPGQR